jgi:hypothetical protein
LRRKVLTTRLGRVNGAIFLLVLIVAGVAPVVLMGTAHAVTGTGASGNTIPNAAQAQATFTPNTPFDSGQPIDVLIPANTVLTPGAQISIFECAAPNGVNPSNAASCDHNTGYVSGNITVQPDGSVDVINTSTNSRLPYVVHALPDVPTLGVSPNGSPQCGLGVANECVLYIGQGGSSDIGLSAPHFFSQPFQVHPDATDSGTQNPGDGAPAQSGSVSPTLSTVTPAAQTATADWTDASTVTVLLRDINSAPVPGKAVSIAAGSGSATVVPASSGSNVTNGNGQAVFTLTDTVAETVTLTATDTADSLTLTHTAQVTFATPTINQRVSTVTANPTQVPNDGQTAATITVELRDNSVHGQPASLVGRTVSLTGMSGSSVIANASPGSNVTDSNGLATFKVTDTVNEVVTYTATDTLDAVTLTGTASVRFGSALSVSAIKSTIVANRTAPQTGSAGTEVAVTLLAADGTSPIIGKTVQLSVTGLASVVGGTTGTSNGSGLVIFQVVDNTPETVTLSAADTTDAVTLASAVSATFSSPRPAAASSDPSIAAGSGPPAPVNGSSATAGAPPRTSCVQESDSPGLKVSHGDPNKGLRPPNDYYYLGVRAGPGCQVHPGQKVLLVFTIRVTGIGPATATLPNLPPLPSRNQQWFALFHVGTGSSGHGYGLTSDPAHVVILWHTATTSTCHPSTNSRPQLCVNAFADRTIVMLYYGPDVFGLNHGGTALFRINTQAQDKAIVTDYATLTLKGSY